MSNVLFLDSKIDQDDRRPEWNCVMCVWTEIIQLVFLGAGFVPKGFPAPKVRSQLRVLCLAMSL